MGLFDEDFADDIDAGRVQSSEGLVEHQHLRVVYQRRSQLHSLLVPVRQCFNLTGGPVRDLQAFQPPHCAGSGGGVIYPVEPAQVLDLLGYEHVWIQAPLFGHVAEPASLVGPDRHPVPAHGPGIQVGEAEDRSHGGGLAGPIRPEEPHDLSRWDAKAQLVEGCHGAEPTAQAVDIEHTGHSRSIRLLWSRLARLGVGAPIARPQPAATCAPDHRVGGTVRHDWGSPTWWDSTSLCPTRCLQASVTMPSFSAMWRYPPLRTADATLRTRSGSAMMSSSTTWSLTMVKAMTTCGCPSSVMTTPAAPFTNAGWSSAAGLAPRRACLATAAAPRTIVDVAGRLGPKSARRTTSGWSRATRASKSPPRAARKKASTTAR